MWNIGMRRIGIVVAAALAATAAMACNNQESATTAAHREATDAHNLVQNAAGVAERMKTDPQLHKLMDQAKAIFIVPNYNKGAIVVGGSGAKVELLAREHAKWSDPAFYDIGAISLGAQAGGKVGDYAMLLMNDKALDKFKSGNAFSLNANAGVTLADYSAQGQASAGTGSDVVLWSSVRGAFAGASIGATDVAFDDDETSAYYGKTTVSAQDILTGKVTGPQEDALGRVLSS